MGRKNLQEEMIKALDLIAEAYKALAKGNLKEANELVAIANFGLEVTNEREANKVDWENQ